MGRVCSPKQRCDGFGRKGSSLLHTVTPYLQYFVAGVAADDNLVFESVLGLGRLDFPIDGWLHQWARVSFE